MPLRPLTPCNKPGCGRLVRGRYCDAHAEQHIKTTIRARDDRRGTPAERGYDAAWAALSKRYRKQHPLCEQHLARGQSVPVALVDHIVPIHVDWSLRLLEDNLQSLCESCHAAKTAEDRKRYGSRSAVISNEPIEVG